MKCNLSKCPDFPCVAKAYGCLEQLQADIKQLEIYLADERTSNRGFQAALAKHVANNLITIARIRGQHSEIAELQAEIADWKELAELREKLLCCYRFSGIPSEKILDKLAVLRNKLKG